MFFDKLLIAYAFTDETIKNEYEFKRFVFTRESTDKVVQEMENPAVVGFSNYIWNTQYNLTLAKKIKAKYPECVIIFGGHNIPPDNSFLKEYGFIDFLIHGEGEEAFKGLLLELCKREKDFSSINNVSYRSADGTFVKNPTVVLTCTDYPSPYLTGLFDYIFEENPDMQLDAILETSRGCPNACAYCDWGCNSSRIRFFPIERIKAEIDWLSEHKVKFVWGADSNFGAAERDLEIVDYLIDVISHYKITDPTFLYIRGIPTAQMIYELIKKTFVDDEMQRKEYKNKLVSLLDDDTKKYNFEE